LRAAAKSGVKKYYLQQFHSQGVSDPELTESLAFHAFPPAIVSEARMLFPVFDVR